MKIMNGIITVVIIVIIIAYLGLYTVNQTQEALLLHLGKIVANDKGQAEIQKPGLHYKWPFLDTARYFDMRLRTLNINSSRIVTVEQKDVIVDAFVKWRIKDIVTYYKSTGGNESRADRLLSQKVGDGLRAEFGKQTILELVAGQRSNVMTLIQQNANEVAQSLGVEVIDVRIKKIDLPVEVTNSVYARMSSNREKEAALIRAQGQENAEKVKAGADADVTVILATAKSNAEKTKAGGDREAAQIYAKAYQKDPKFYNFYRSLQAYSNVFEHKKDTLVLQPEGQFFNFFKSLSGLGVSKS